MKRIVIGLALLLFASVSAQATVLRVVIDDMIHPISDEFLGRALDAAADQKADAVLLELRTPGGLETSMRGMVEKIMKSPVPVIVWVGPSGARAASAGFFILEAADLAAMAPGTNTGAAHPVTIGGAKMDDVLKLKMQNDAAAFIRTIAQRRGRNVKAAESGVREAKSFTEDEALATNLIEVVAADVPSLLRWADGKTVRRFHGAPAVLHVKGKPVVDYKMTLREHLFSKVLDPNIAFLLLVLGAMALYAEFSHPGAILPGVVGLVSILIAIAALNRRSPRTALSVWAV
jgi:membrane-bound serine protease (ClpP class)